MTDKLRWRFVLVAMVAIATVMVIVLSSINMANIYKTNKNSDELLSIISDNDGRIPFDEHKIPDDRPPKKPELGPEGRYLNRYFTVRISESDSIISVDNTNIAADVSNIAIGYVNQILEDGQSKGTIDNYRYSLSTKNGTSLIVFLDISKEQHINKSFLTVSLIVLFISLLIVFLLLVVLSKKAIQPFVDNLNRQKEFISNASHEIKTPLAILSANNEVLELISGESKWTISNHNQIRRLKYLIEQMLMLSTLEEKIDNLVFQEIDLSKILIDAMTEFSTIYTNIKVKTSIQENVFILADKGSIVQLVNIILDNAFKYVTDDGNIFIELSQNKDAILSVSNSCELINKEDLNKIFDRFYRLDEARTRQKGGNGMGLSIAKAIVDKHNAKISAETDDDNNFIMKVKFYRKK